MQVTPRMRVFEACKENYRQSMTLAELERDLKRH
jgi:hypothetical protein